MSAEAMNSNHLKCQLREGMAIVKNDAACKMPPWQAAGTALDVTTACMRCANPAQGCAYNDTTLKWAQL
jgi:hypothetical protein